MIFILTLEFLVLLCAVVVATLIYRCLIRSRLFTEFLNGFQPPTESETEAIERIHAANVVGASWLDDAESTIERKRAAVKQLRKLVK